MDEHDQGPEVPAEFIEKIEQFTEAMSSQDGAAFQRLTAEMLKLLSEMEPPEPTAADKIVDEFEALKWQGEWDAALHKIYELEQHSDFDARGVSALHLRAAGIHDYLNQPDRAVEHARIASTAERTWLGEMDLELAFGACTHSLACYLLDTRQAEEAKQVLEELRASVAASETMREHHQFYIRLDTDLARCALVRGDLDEAQEILNQSRCMLDDMLKNGFGSILNYEQSRWWKVLAQLREHQHDYAQATKAWRKAGEFLRPLTVSEWNPSVGWWVSLARVLRRQGTNLDLIGQSEFAAAAWEEAESIEQRFHLPCGDS